MQHALAGAGVRCLSPAASTTHVVFIVIGGGVRKKDYLENQTLAPNLARLAREAYVFEEDHSERVASHRAAFAELLQGREFTASRPAGPTILDCVNSGIMLDSIQAIPQTLAHLRPRILVCRALAHDVGHESYEKYLNAVNATDGVIGRVFDWIKSHAYFQHNTAIVIRPEFGRDDEVNEHGQLHHSYGFYSAHRVASIFWGPDFNRGVNKQCVISALDMAPTLAKLLNVDASYMQGRVAPRLFKRKVASG